MPLESFSIKIKLQKDYEMICVFSVTCPRWGKKNWFADEIKIQHNMHTWGKNLKATNKTILLNK